MSILPNCKDDEKDQPSSSASCTVAKKFLLQGILLRRAEHSGMGTAAQLVRLERNRFFLSLGSTALFTQRFFVSILRHTLYIDSVRPSYTGPFRTGLEISGLLAETSSELLQP